MRRSANLAAVLLVLIGALPLGAAVPAGRPIAEPQLVVTNAPAPLLISLSGHHPGGEALTFSILKPPRLGTLGEPIAAGPGKATVTYTPPAIGDEDEDRFTFQVRDPSGEVAQAVVEIYLRRKPGRLPVLPVPDVAVAHPPATPAAPATESPAPGPAVSSAAEPARPAEPLPPAAGREAAPSPARAVPTPATDSPAGPGGGGGVMLGAGAPTPSSSPSAAMTAVAASGGAAPASTPATAAERSDAAAPAGSPPSSTGTGSGTGSGADPGVAGSGGGAGSGSPAPPMVFSDLAVFATNSIALRRNATVTGSLAVQGPSVGPPVAPGFELAIDRDARITGGLKADSVRIDRDSVVSGEVFANQLVLGGGVVIADPSVEPFVAPAFAAVPPAQEASGRPGVPDVLAAAGTTTLGPGEYGDVLIAANATLLFTGGVYHLRSIGTVGDDCAVPCRSLRFGGPSDVRVAGTVELGSFAVAAPVDGSGVGPRDVILYVNGGNGPSGAAAAVGRNSVLAANVYAPNGRVQVGRNSAITGALLGFDVLVDQGATIQVASYFANRAPVADPQVVFTDGAAPLPITLTGSDPEGESLAFSIVTPPTQGALGPVVPVNGTTATVTYTPATAGNLEDSFTFKVTDPHGGIGQAVVQINPPAEPTTPPPPVDTVVAFDAAVEALSGQPVTITLQGNAPDGTDLTFSIVEPPASGAVSTPVPVPGSPARMATVTYQSSPGFVGADAFRFEACGIIGEATVCAQATVTVQVSELQTVVAQDQEVTTRENVLVQITLGAVSSLGGASEVRLGARSALVTEVIDRGAAVAGSVADSTDPRDGLGDNHTDLPGPAPVLVAAAVDATGGPGSNGTIRIQMEWEVASLGLQPLSVASAEVLLHTVKGTVDALDTFFLAGTGEQDGLLADADFQAPATAIPGAVMPVPDGPAGSEGTFAFDVTAPLQRALALDRSHFSIQGRVNEALTGFQRGLQVRTTATGNLTDQLEPRLRISLAEGAPEFVFTIVTLPAHGTLLDSTSTPITTVPAILPSRTLTFVPTPAFNGLDEFIFSASDGVTVDQALVELVIQPAVGPGGPGGSGGDCEVDPDGCDNGR